MLKKATISILSVAALLLGAAPAAIADELVGIYRQILRDPLNADLNLQYAMIAEGRGEYRKALAAYERVLVNDPGNQSAIEGIQRVRRIIEPAVTLKTLEAGARWESNALRSEDNAQSEYTAYGSFRIRDERALGQYRWRTLFGAYGEAHSSFDFLNYLNLSAESGPLIDVPGTMITLRPAVGTSASFFDDRFYNWDVNASLGIEGYLQGAYQWAKLRVGYRAFDPSFVANSGMFADLTGRAAFKDVLTDGDVASIAPFLRWSNIDGQPEDSFDFAPGRYFEVGTTLEYSKALSEQLTAAVSVRVRDLLYADVGLGARNDYGVAPGAALIARNVFGPQTDLRFDYRFEQNWSNQAGHDWQNHVFKLAFVSRR